MQMPKVRNERHVYLDRTMFLCIIRQMQPGSSRAAVKIAFYSGMRVSEVVDKSRVQLRGATMVFILQSSDTKNDAPRAVPIHPKIMHIVRNSSLWPISRTKWTVSKDFKSAARSAGFGHARLHDVRHSTASEMINSGVSLFTVGGVLGHKSAASTRRYSHLLTSTLEDAIKTVGKKPPTTPKEKAA